MNQSSNPKGQSKAQRSKFKIANPGTNSKSGGLFYTHDDLFDTPFTLDYASVVPHFITICGRRVDDYSPKFRNEIHRN